MSRAVTYTDFFVLVTGSTTRQTAAIAESIREALRSEGIKPIRSEGVRAAEWILLDYLDVVVHVFTPEARGFYRLERLWGDVPQVSLQEDDDLSREWARLRADHEAREAEEETA